MKLNRGGGRIQVCIRLLAGVMAALGLLSAVGCSLSPGNSDSSGLGSGGPAAGVLTASSKKVRFGGVPVQTSTAQLVTLTDTGKSNVTISTVSATGSGFSASGGSNVTLTPNQSVTISVNFEPASAGDVEGKLSISSNASNSHLRIDLSGTGLQQESRHVVTLEWQASSSEVIGYFIYRGATQSDLSRLNNSVDPFPSYTDTTVAGGQTYIYEVTSVESHNIESAPSNPVSVSIPSE